MKPHCLLASLLAFAGLTFSGCETGRSARIQEKSSVYALFSDELKARVNQGSIDLGDSTDAAYIALGKPSVVSTHPSGMGEVTVWTYKRFVIGEEMSSRIDYSQPGRRFDGTAAKGAGARTGVSLLNTAPARGGEQGSVDAGIAETVTLHVDILDNKVVGLRVDR